MGAGATAAAHLAADVAEDIDALSTTAVENAAETFPFGSMGLSYNLQNSKNQTVLRFGVSGAPLQSLKSNLLAFTDDLLEQNGL